MNDNDAFRLWTWPQADRDTVVFWTVIVLAVWAAVFIPVMP